MTADPDFPLRQIRFALGEGSNLGRAKNVSESYDKFRGRFREPFVTPEKRHEYLKMNDRRQAHLKGTAGWYMRAPVGEGKRTRDSIKPGDLITLDIDYATPEFMAELLDGNILSGVTLFAHTTRSSTPEKPRARILIPTKNPLPADRYQAACRIVAQLVDPEMKVVDKVSARVAQMMYLPTVSSDMAKHYVFYEQPGGLLDWEKVIRLWEKKNGSANDIANLPRFPGEHELREAAEKAEDPLTKDGIVGTFCRAWSITELVTGKDGEPGPLEDLYEATEWHNGVITRMSYTKGSTSNGAVVYDDKFVYSHHGSDPAQDQLLNAYDLCRYHLHNAAADDTDDPMGERPSVKAMNKWAAELPAYKRQVVEERYDLDTMFADDDDTSWIDDGTDDEERDLLGFDHLTAGAQATADQAELDEISALLGVPVETVVETGPSRYQRMRAAKPPKNWVATELELTDDGTIRSTLHNVAVIVTNDPRFFRKIAYNEFSNQVVLLSDIKTKSKTIPEVRCTDRERGMLWSDLYDITIRAVIEAPNGRGKPGYGFKVSDRDLVSGVKLAARNNAFHPIREKIAGWRGTWDGKPRIATFMQRTVGAEDSVFVSEAFKLMLVASIARIETPGHKFDYATILEGPQGIGKSTLIKLLYGEEFFGEIDVDLADRRQVAEQIAGKWALELPELSSLHKADHNNAKHFMRRTDDDVREAYGRTVSRFPRQCVFWGTTNDRTYLRDPTGNRSYWIVKCNTQSIDFRAVLRERDQLWAEAVAIYDEMRARYPSGTLPLTLSHEAEAEAKRLQENARQKEMWENWLESVLDWIERPVRKEALFADNGWDLDPLGSEDVDELVLRAAFTAEQAFVGALGLREGELTNPTHAAAWAKVSGSLAELGYAKTKCRVRGKQARWHIIPGRDTLDLRRGFALSGEAKPTSESRAPESLI